MEEEKKKPSTEEGSSTEEKEVITVEEVDSLKQALAQEKAKAEGYLANWQRAQADYINLKRRTEQEKGEASRFSNTMLLINLLPVVDDLERALASLPTRLAGLSWVEGIRLIYRKLVAVLEGQGLSVIKATGEPFDPKVHEAVLYSEGEEGIILEEVQKGYMLQERVLRPSLVVVGKGKEKKSEEPSSKEE